MTSQIIKLLDALNLSPKVPTAKKATDIKIQNQSPKTTSKDKDCLFSYMNPIDKPCAD